MEKQFLKKWRTWLSLFVLIFCALPINAYDLNDGHIKIDSKYDKNGCVTMTIPFYEIGGVGNAKEGLIDPSYVELGTARLIDIRSFASKGSPQPGGKTRRWVEIQRSDRFDYYCERVEIIGSHPYEDGQRNNLYWNTNGWVKTWSDHDSNGIVFITLKFYFRPTAFDNVVMDNKDLSVHLTVDRNENTDYSLDKSVKLSRMQFNPASITAKKKMDEQGKYTVTVDASQHPYPEQVEISYFDNGELHVIRKQSKYTFDVDVKNECREDFVTVKYLVRKRVSSDEYWFRQIGYQSFYVPGYDYVEQFEAKQIENGKVRLSWKTINDIEGTKDKQLDPGGFIITRQLKDGTNATITLNEADQREYIDEQATNYPDEVIKYSIRRQKPSEWTTFKLKEQEVVIKNTHTSVNEFTSVKLLSQRTAELKWKWDYAKANNYVLTENSRFLIVRKKSVDGKTFVEDVKKEIDCIEFIKGGEFYNEKDSSICIYNDAFEQSCILYKWEITLVPGNNNYRTKPASHPNVYLMPKIDDRGNVVVDEEGNIVYTSEDENENPYIGLNDKKVGEVEKFTASHGFFGDRVELAWTMSKKGGSLDVYSVQRREINGNEDTKFAQIGTVEGIPGITSYTYTDTKAVPGKVYEYLIEGTKECADQEAKTKNFAFGFCTTSGNIFGRLTFKDENGQAVHGAEVRLETKADIIGKSYHFGGRYHLAVSNDSLFREQKADSVTFQMYAKFAGTDINHKQILMQQGNNFSIYALNNKIHFQVGELDIESNDNIPQLTKESSFMQITAVSAPDSLRLYINNVFMGGEPQTNTGKAITDGPLTMGNDFYGYLDEVRIWGKPLSAEEIKLTFDRYISGDEERILAYWNFNYCTTSEFYDVAHKDGNYFMNDGKVVDKYGKFVEAIMSSDPRNNPSSNQLAYKDYTDIDGSYYIAGVPYIGNGTLYTIIPRLGTHEFSPTKTQVTISNGSVNHSANFIDKSAFPVSGTIRYEGSTIPVEGVEFYVDGVACSDDKNNFIQTDANGNFKIYVPVGVHEVRAKKAHHKFKNDGRLLDDYGHDINYQDDRYSTVELWDVTKVKFIGRVAGGAIQQALPVGHSLSKNNLGDGISVQLTYENPAYQLNASESDITETMTHYLPGSWMDKGKVAKENKVIYRGKSNVINIIPNSETGEFIAEVLPISYAVKVNAPAAYTNISGNKSKLNLSDVFAVQSELYEYEDSMLVNNQMVTTQYSDTVYYNQKQLFIARVKPVINVEQMNGSTPLKYFGAEKAELNTLGNTEKVSLYNKKTGKYLLGIPAFAQNDTYRLRASVYEEYKYYNEQGDVDTDRESDKVPSQDATINFQTTMSSSNDSEDVEADSTGVAYWEFKVNKIDLTSGNANINVRAKVGNDNNATSFAWTSPFSEDNIVITLGSVSQGTDFVTSGPDKILAVLRDPPGSNSYSYLEKGVTFTESSQYKGGLYQEGNEEVTTSTGTKLITYAGSPVAGKIETSVESTAGAKVHVAHKESWSDAVTKTNVTTINTRIQTSDDDDYVGEIDDTFIGYSTNVSFGESEIITLISKDRYNAKKDDYHLMGFTDETGDKMLVRTKSMEVGTFFNTFFIYPMLHIEEVLIPKLYEIRNSFLHPYAEMTPDQFQAEANVKKSPIYVSYLDSSDENYGLSNTDEVFKDDPKYYKKPGNKIFDGPSYKVYYPNDQVNRTDTIASIMQSIHNWEDRLRDNEKAKVEAIQSGNVLQNYSFQAGSTIEYSKAFSNKENRTNTFEIVAGIGGGNDWKAEWWGSGARLEIMEEVGTNQGGEFVSESEATVNVGFVLNDTGNDYLTVDVYQEGGGMNSDISSDNVDSKDLNLSTLIFRTRGGATCCPYEGETKTRYFEPGQHKLNEATLPVEAPKIAVENAFIDNVPSGEPAYVKLFLRNNSAVHFDTWYNLIIDDKANKLGAKLKMDGGAISNGRTVLVPAGETITKILEVTKGPGMNYDDIKLVLASQCQGDRTANFPILADTVSFSVHFTPSCSDIDVVAPSNNWVYNTEMPTQKMSDGKLKHYMPVKLSNFNVNYDNFKSIRLMYKPSSDSDENWITLMNYFTDEDLYNECLKNGQNAQLITAEDKGTLNYKWFIDDMPDQKYDLCAATVCDIDNVEVLNFSETHTGVKDMYRPRLFGTPQPANGILTINDEAMIRFNETIAAGYLTQNNFEVTGVKNGSKTNHSVAVEVDGNDTFNSELERSLRGKDITFEAWINIPKQQNATIFEHGSGDEKLSFGITEDRKLTATVNKKVYTSEAAAEKDYVNNWNHVALVLDQAENGMSTGKLTLYFNFVAVLEVDGVPAYTQNSTYTMARSLVGQIHNIRLWTTARSSGDIQTGSNIVLSGNEANLLSYYPMDEARGNVLKDKARGLNMAMNGGKWILPEGKALVLNGSNSYLKLSSGKAIVVDKETDYTIELWFKGGSMNQNAALLASGKGDGTDHGGSENLFFLGFEKGKLVYKNNGKTLEGTGSYLDGNWHHVAVAANRITQRVQMYVDGALNAYTDATDFGQIAAPYIYIGTTPVMTDNTNTVCTNYFNGVVDDVRFWNMYKNEKSVAASISDRLDGSEMGLLSYLPFEKHGVTEANIPVVRFSLEDAKVPAPTDTQNDDAIAVLSDVEFPKLNAENRLTLEDAFMTSAIAPVKDLGAAVDLLFDFVVNNDALIVTLKEDPAKIEKSTVNFTISDVRDLNGNKIASPITWTAYINRNQLKWGENEINLVKDVNEPLEFTVDITNIGGFTEEYTISNNPSWMYVEPSYGSLTATQTEHIKFTVDESVNIGTYNEVIYLTNADGVTEALNVNLKVNGEKPEWNVNPADYKYSMNVYGQLEINNRFSNDLEDMLAAFEGDKCVGVANNQYIRVNDMYYVLLTVYSNSAKHDNLNFKMWDASTGTTYVASPESVISFNANTIVGSPKAPVIFKNLDLVQLDIKLNEGWSWTSFNVKNDKMNNIAEVLKNNMWQNGDEIKREDGGVATYGTREGWVGTLKSFDNNGMFMIRSSYDQTLSVIGAPVDPAENILTIKSVNDKNVAVWNYIPYLGQYNLRLNEALAGYEAIEGDVIKSQSAFAMYNNSLGWIGSLEYMQPGLGYMLQRVGTESATLQYPSENTMSDRSQKIMMTKAMDEGADCGYMNNRYAQTMSVVATVTGIEASEGDVLNFYVDGELRGKSPVICRDEQGRVLFFASIAGDKNEMMDVTIERNGEAVAGVAAWNTFAANTVCGTYNTPEEINFESLNKTVYPSPFDQELFIESVVDPNAEVVVTITNMNGAVVATFTDCNDNGQVHIHWTGASKCTRGVYLVNISVDGKDSVYKVVKII